MKAPIVIVLLCAAVAGHAQQPAKTEPAPLDRADLERTQIIGNRELPKVLYIVPWKKPVPGALSGRPVASVLDEALAPIDREVFRREVQYEGAVHPREAPAKNP